MKPGKLPQSIRPLPRYSTGTTSVFVLKFSDFTLRGCELHLIAWTILDYFLTSVTFFASRS
jgi:hypothetical protein